MLGQEHRLGDLAGVGPRRDMGKELRLPGAEGVSRAYRAHVRCKGGLPTTQGDPEAAAVQGLAYQLSIWEIEVENLPCRAVRSRQEELLGPTRGPVDHRATDRSAGNRSIRPARVPVMAARSHTV